MFEILFSQNVCVYVIVMCGLLGAVGRAVMGGYLKSLIKGSDRMGHTKKKALLEIRKRYEDIASLDVDIRDVSSFVDKYIDRLKIGVVPINVWNGFVKNLGVIAAGTGIFAAVYQYYVVGNNGEAVKMTLCSLAACLVLYMAGNQWDPSWYMMTLRDNVRNYLGNSLSNRLKKEDRKQAAATVQEVVEHSGDAVPVKKSERKKKGDKTADKGSYDELLDKMMQKILADG